MYGKPPRACHCDEWPSFIARAKELGRFGNVLNSKIRKITVVQDEDGNDIEVSREKAHLGKRKTMFLPGLALGTLLVVLLLVYFFPGLDLGAWKLGTHILLLTYCLSGSVTGARNHGVGIFCSMRPSA